MGKVSGVDLSETSPEKTSLKTGIPAGEIREAAKAMASASSPAVVYGTRHSDKDSQRFLKAVLLIAEMTGANVISPKGQANSLAAAQLGLDSPFAINGHQAVFVALGDEAPSPSLLQKIEKAPFLAVMASYYSAATARADVVLPVTVWSETEGHYLNVDGRLQQAMASVEKPEEVWAPAAVLEGIAGKANLAPANPWKEMLEQAVSPVPLQLN
jgi:anaerobic selenocysteine-containing dehydrogenase